jgi:hypothetical protein
METPMGEVGGVDRDEPFSVAQRILLLRPGEGVSGEFLALVLQSGPVRRAIEYRATGSGVEDTKTSIAALSWQSSPPAIMIGRGLHALLCRLPVPRDCYLGLRGSLTPYSS